MSDPKTTAIAKAVRDALATAVAASSDATVAAARVWAFGASDDTAATSRSEQFPDVFVRVRGAGQQQYKSVLRSYPIDVLCRTYQPADRFGVTLQALAELVGDWIRTGPSITASGLSIKALYLPDAPEDADEQREGGSVWGYRWSGTVNAQVTA